MPPQIIHVNGRQVDLTAVGMLGSLLIRRMWTPTGLQACMTTLAVHAALQIDGDVPRNTAVYGDADVGRILCGGVRPPEPFKGLIDALVALEE